MSTASVVPTLLSLSEVAARLDVSVKTVRRMIADGQLRPTNVSASPLKPNWRVSEDEVRRFVKRRT